jgi:hypothetical protein
MLARVHLLVRSPIVVKIIISINSSSIASSHTSLNSICSHFYGASLLALDRLGRKHGYALVACDSSGTNAFFVDTKWAGWAQQGEGRNMTTRLSALGPLPTLHSAFVRAAYVGEYTKVMQYANTAFFLFLLFIYIS